MKKIIKPYLNFTTLLSIASLITISASSAIAGPEFLNSMNSQQNVPNLNQMFENKNEVKCENLETWYEFYTLTLTKENDSVLIQLKEQNFTLSFNGSFKTEIAADSFSIKGKSNLKKSNYKDIELESKYFLNNSVVLKMKLTTVSGLAEMDLVCR